MRHVDDMTLREIGAKVAEIHGKWLRDEVRGDASNAWMDWCTAVNSIIGASEPADSDTEAWDAWERSGNAVQSLVALTARGKYGGAFCDLEPWQREEVFTDVCEMLGYDVSQWRRNMMEVRP